MKKKPAFAKLSMSDTGRWMSCPPDFRQMQEAEESFNKAVQSVKDRATEAGCTVGQHIHDEYVITMPEGMDFSEIEQRILAWVNGSAHI